MPELTKEQKEDLKNYEKKRQKYFVVIIIVVFVAMPAFHIIMRNKFPSFFDLFFPQLPLLIILSALLIDIHYGKKCPVCSSKLIDGDISGGERLPFFSLPEKCNKCGIKLK